MKVNILGRYKAPSNAHILGTDESGRDVLALLIIGARNSVVIGFSVTILDMYHRYHRWIDFWLLR